MLEVGRRRDLCQEPLGSHHRCEFGLQDLERDFTFVLEVIGQVDGGHAAFAEFRLDAVATFQGCVQAGYGIRHAQKMRGGSVERE